MKSIRILMITIAFGAIVSCNNQNQSEETELAVPVSVEDIKPQTIRKIINTTGTVNATFEAELSSKVAGEYNLLRNPATGSLFKLGSKVKAGQEIIKLEDDEYVNSIAIESKRLNLEISEQEYEKQKSLYEKGGVTLRELRNSEISLTNAKYEYEIAKIKLEDMKIVAPFSGIIVDLPYYTPGTRVASGVLMASLMSYDKMYMEINLPEKNLADVKTGQKVWVTSYTLPDDTLQGTVADLSPAISTETRTFKGNISINNPGLNLRPGMFVKAGIIISKKDNVIVIPKDIVVSTSRDKLVYIVERSAARERRITTGIENEGMIEVIDGLKFNDRLVVKGFETLRNGSKVKVIR